MAHCQVQEWNPEGSIAVVDQITESGGTEFGMKAHQEPEKGLSVCLSVCPGHHQVPAVPFKGSQESQSLVGRAV